MLLRLKNFTARSQINILQRYFADQQHAIPINFDNHQEAFKSKRTVDLVRATSILSLCSLDILVDNALKLMRAGEAVLGTKLFSSLMRSTFYGQFVAGETGPAVTEAARRLKNQGLTLMVAPALESDLGEGSSSGLLESNLNEYLSLAKLTGEERFGETRSACLQLKMTAVVPTDLLAKLTSILNQSTKEEKMKIVAILSNLMTENLRQREVVPGFNPEIMEELHKSCIRLHNIGKLASEVKIRLLVDMEWTYVNPACSAFASAMMAVFNKESPAVCSTVQCYLKAALDTLKWENEVAEHFGVCYGAKLVRGAYLEKERQVAPHMVCQSYEETCANYDKVMKNAVERAVGCADKKHFIIVATHNEAAITTATSFLQELQVRASNNANVAFAQIYGMAEHISLPLAQANYLVYKSVAFGSLHQVVPYLARRAAENRAVMKGARRERELMMSEIKRRASQPLH